MEYLYLLGMVALVPFFTWQQKMEGRYYAAFFASGALLIYWLFSGFPVVMDETTILAGCFAIWMAASVLWSHSRQTPFDLYAMLCGLVVFMAARTIQTDIVLIMVLVPGVIFAAVSLYNYNRPITCILDFLKRYFIFGNQNHLGCFYLMPLFSALWLTFNTSFWFAPLVAFLGVAIGLSDCRGAQIGAFIGLLVAGLMQSMWFAVLIPVIIGVGYVLAKSRIKSNWHRVSIWMAAMLMIKRNPLCGYGLRTFRREYPAIMPELLAHPLTKHFFSRGQGYQEISSHRVHNDHLEIIMELGLIGYALLLFFFFSLPLQTNALLSGAIVAFAVHGLFFFPLREAHTALPFWAVVGAVAPVSAVPMELNPLVAWVLVLAVSRLLYGVFIKCWGLWWYDRSLKVNVSPSPETPEQHRLLQVKQNYLNEAIGRDPYNNTYLTEGYYYNVFNVPEAAFQYASRCVENFDGGKTKWGVMDQYARALLRLGGFGVARMALKYALHISPGFNQSMNLMAQLDSLEKGKV